MSTTTITPRASAKPQLARCKFCSEFVNLDVEGSTFADGSVAHEGCDDARQFREANAADFRD